MAAPENRTMHRHKERQNLSLIANERVKPTFIVMYTAMLLVPRISTVAWRDLVDDVPFSFGLRPPTAGSPAAAPHSCWATVFLVPFPEIRTRSGLHSSEELVHRSTANVACVETDIFLCTGRIPETCCISFRCMVSPQLQYVRAHSGSSNAYIHSKQWPPFSRATVRAKIVVCPHS